MILKGTGNLYRGAATEPFVSVKYNLLVDVSKSTGNHIWSGECVLTRKEIIREGELLAIELDSGHLGKCSLRKKVNKAVMGLPIRYFYHLTGMGNLTRKEGRDGAGKSDR